MELVSREKRGGDRIGKPGGRKDQSERKKKEAERAHEEER